MARNAHFPITASLRVVLCEGLDNLSELTFGHEPRAANFEELRLLLEALPLDTEEFGLAVNRLANAWQYVESGEYGAAGYELRLLRRSLKE